MERLYTPWRYDYLVSDKANQACIFCTALQAGEDRRRLIVLRGRHNFVILNRYPYNSGHVMVAPNRHVARLADCPTEALHELMELAVRCESALREEYHPQGINVGMNLGEAAGAGIADHFHLHMVPRWSGDTSFISVLGETRVIPEELDHTWQRLSAALARDGS